MRTVTAAAGLPASPPEVEALRQATKRFARLVERLRRHELERASPCRGWRVRDVVAHQVAVAEWVRTDFWEPVLGGRQPRGVDLRDLGNLNQAGVERYRDAPNLSALLRQAHAKLLRVLDTIVAAGKLDRPGSYFGEGPVRLAVCTLTIDVLIHTWDIGQGTSRRSEPPAALLAPVLPQLLEGFFPRALDPARAGGLTCSFGLEVIDIPAGHWIVAVDRGGARIERRPISETDVTVKASAATFALVYLGRVHPLRAILTGRLSCRGNPFLGLKFLTLTVKV